MVIAFDVLEHVPDYQKALQEVHRVLSPGGYAIFTVPQKDNLLVTFEDPSIVQKKTASSISGSATTFGYLGKTLRVWWKARGSS